jgi:hypothetical protein
MVMLIAGGSLSTGSHDPYSGTLMPRGAVHPISGDGSSERINDDAARSTYCRD